MEEILIETPQENWKQGTGSVQDVVNTAESKIWRRFLVNDTDIGTGTPNKRLSIHRKLTQINTSLPMSKARCVRDARTSAQRVKLDGSGPCEGAISYTYDGHSYDLVEIGNDCWFAEDLQTTVNAAGDTLVLEW